MNRRLLFLLRDQACLASHDATRQKGVDERARKRRTHAHTMGSSLPSSPHTAPDTSHAKCTAVRLTLILT